jgi:hypothetical protein
MGARNQVGIRLSYQPAREGNFKLLRIPGIDTKKSIPPAYVAWQAVHNPIPTRFIAPDASINNTQEYTLVYVFIRSANSELTYKSPEQFI